MPGTTVLFGQILAVFGIVSTGTWGAAQWTATHRGSAVEREEATPTWIRTAGHAQTP